MRSVKSNNRKRMLSFLLALTIAMMLPVSGNAESESKTQNNVTTVSQSKTGTDYGDYYDSVKTDAAAESAVTLTAASVTYSSDASVKILPEYEGGKNVVFWEKGNGTVSWSFNVPKTALYEVEITYLLPESGMDLETELLLDGKMPFEQCSEITLYRYWKNSTDEFETDDADNQLVPEQTEIRKFTSKTIADNSGEYNEPFVLLLTAGAHTLSLSSPKQSIAIEKITLLPPETVKTYAEVSSDYAKNDSTATETVTIQGEAAAVKSTNALIPKSDTENAGMTPANPGAMQLNYIGGTSWQTPCEELVWNFTAPAAGYYTLGFRYKQSEVINGESHRWLKIDGKTPFEEAKDIRFTYHTGWELYTFGESDDEPYYIWLDEGEHQLSMTVTMGTLAESQRRLNKIVEELSDVYINMIQITGVNPDVNRDYELFKQIPDLESRLTAAVSALKSLAADMRKLSGKRSSQYIAAMDNMVRVINNMTESPYTAQYYIKDYYTNYSSLSSWLYEMKSMPLSLDEIYFTPVGVKPAGNKAGFWKSASFTVQRLAYSFTKDYTNLNENDEQSGTTLKLWTTWGRDQANALNSLIRSSFTAKTGIKVNVQQVNCSLVNGLLAGNYPDMLLQLSRTEPLNLGMRGALYDLSSFSDCEEVLKRFQPGAETPYRYNGKLFALPDTQSFFVMFYRSDILESLGLTVPKTWNEFLSTTTIIRRNHLDVYIPYTQIADTTTVNGGIGSLSLFPTLLVQNGLSLYNDKQDAAILDDENVVKVFEQWTDLYTKNLYLKVADFYNRFRTGTMPLGIASYATYMTLRKAAPEIQGKWSMALLPSTENGNSSVTGGGTGCVIVKKTAHPNEAWEFLKWWTDTDTQVRYSQNVESLLGLLGRPTTSNVEAFKKLSWESETEEILLEQWSRVVELPEVPGSYYLSRAVDQAFWSVVNGESNAKDATLKWNDIANEEIKQKISEYSK